MRKVYHSLTYANRLKTHGLTLMPRLVRPPVLVQEARSYLLNSSFAPRMRALPLRAHGVQGTVTLLIEATHSLTISVLTCKYYTVIFGVSRGA